jgi:hypothetical protein
MPKMPHPRHHHRQPPLVRRRDHLRVAHGPAGLDHRRGNYGDMILIAEFRPRSTLALHPARKPVLRGQDTNCSNSTPHPSRFILPANRGQLPVSFAPLRKAEAVPVLLVPEMPDSRKHHRQPPLIRRRDHLRVPHGPARLDHRRGPGLGRRQQAVGEGEERVRRHDAACRQAFDLAWPAL